MRTSWGILVTTMQKLFWPIALFIVILIAAVVLILLPGKTEAPTVTDNGTATTTPQATTTPATGDESNENADMITISSPTKGATVASPLTITGSARGGWYFEASFPIELRDASGKMIAQYHAEAQSDWMTSNFVPFKATLTFAKQPAGSTGTLILRNDNPSGLPENDRSVEIPVKF
jgi:hypothetical protein